MKDDTSTKIIKKGKISESEEIHITKVTSVSPRGASKKGKSKKQKSVKIDNEDVKVAVPAMMDDAVMSAFIR